MRRSVIDVGSNSVLLLVSEVQDGKWVPIHEDTAITALGEGTKQTGLLSEIAMVRTLAAIRRFVDKAAELGCATTLTAATMAARIATNSDDFLGRGLDHCTPISILSGEQEAQLGFESVVNDPLFANRHRITILDPGGQSTEVVVADRVATGWEVLFKRSYPVGTLGLKSDYFPDERCNGLQVLRASGAIDEIVGTAYQPNDPGTVVVLGAAGTNLVSIKEKLATWQPERVHGSSLDFEFISNSVGHLMPLSDSERASIVGMEPGRERTIHIGALLVERFLFALRAEECLVSVRGWRHALLEKSGLEPL
jgi:exopolyphosphatase / guanosine-5'-triphosphate,3'-diphosphate pyrophosphatase